jgi:hypothetical protein
VAVDFKAAQLKIKAEGLPFSVQEKQRKDKKEERTEIVWANMPT